MNLKGVCDKSLKYSNILHSGALSLFFFPKLSVGQVLRPIGLHGAYFSIPNLPYLSPDMGS